MWGLTATANVGDGASRNARGCVSRRSAVWRRTRRKVGAMNVSRFHWVCHVMLLSVPLVLGIVWLGSSAVLGQSQPRAAKKEHAERFKFKTGKKIPELAARAKNQEIIEIEVHQSTRWGLPNDILPSYPHPYLVVLSRGADAVVIGVAKSGVSGLTANEEFIYSDWQFEIEEILKDNPSSPLAIFSHVTVTRPGGTLTIHGKQVHARHTNFLPFAAGARICYS